MTRLTNIVLVLIAVSAAGAMVGCSAIVGSTLDEKGPGRDGGTSDTGVMTNCTTDMTLCNATMCQSVGRCEPGNAAAHPVTGCVPGDGVDNALQQECEFPLRDDSAVIADGVCFNAVCAGCGDGITQDGFIDPADNEECDDGNNVDGDGCDNDCRYSCHNVTDCNPFDCNGTVVCSPPGANNLRECVTTPPFPACGSTCNVIGQITDGMCFEPGEDGLVCCHPTAGAGMDPLCCGFFPGQDEYSCGPPAFMPMCPPP